LFGLKVGLTPGLVVPFALGLVFGLVSAAGDSFFLVLLLTEFPLGPFLVRVGISHTVCIPQPNRG
jgi:hypothetical protein